MATGTATDPGRAPAPAALFDAAFGACPGLHPLPPATTAESRWWRAVALGGQGRYAAAEVELATVLRDAAGASGTSLTSLAASTQGSHLRQAGQHAAARPWDARALLATTAPPARTDALVGLAADALGTGQTEVAHRLLARAQPGLAAAGWRGTMRWHWVAAEIALCEGARSGAHAHAEQGVRLAVQCASVRHQVKSQLLLAAALGGEDGATLAGELLEQAQEHGLLPLHWAAAMLLTALKPGSPAVATRLQSTTEALSRRGFRQRLR
ncbi:MAG: hypothetical protein ABI251_05165 [Mycobacteriaceae bacterium]